ncbi:MAG: hypothetical protein D8B50_03430 [Prevotella sp.]|nr:MAG: hypothetical protein D8B50_03430 [Prevotella sp.]
MAYGRNRSACSNRLIVNMIMKGNGFFADFDGGKEGKRGCFALFFRLNLRVKRMCLCTKVIDFTREKHRVWV